MQVTWLADAARDLRLAARSLRRTPGFSAVVVGSLALAIGAVTAIFTLVHGVLLRPLPFAAPDELVQVFGRAASVDRPDPAEPVGGPVGSLELETYQRESATIRALAAYSVGAVVLEDAVAAPERVRVVDADLSLFPVLGAAPIAGRAFRDGDARDVVVVSERLWTRRWQRAPDAVGSAVAIGGEPMTVVGVMPESFQFPYSAASILPSAAPEARTDLWRPLPPLRAAPDGALRRGRVSVVGRLMPGVTAAAATAELHAMAARLSAATAADRLRYDARAVPLGETVAGAARLPLWILFAAAGLVLAVACANVANLLLARVTIRMREVVTRAALGAGPFRLVRQFLAESLLVSAAAALAGLAAAAAIVRWLVSVGAGHLPRAHEIGVDWTVFAFAAALAGLTAIAFGALPAFAAAQAGGVAVIKEGGHLTPGRRLSRLRDGLVVVEVALAAALALGATVVVREAARLERQPMGMTTEHVLTMHLTPRLTAAEYASVAARASAVPGVRTAAMIQLLPLRHWGWEGTFTILGRDAADRMTAELRYVTPGYFEALDIPVLRGRAFDARDVAEAPPVIVVNQALAARYLGGRDPVGVVTDRGVIAGVVGDVRQVGLNRPAAPEIYFPIAQNLAVLGEAGMSLVLRTAEAPTGRLADAVRAAVQSAYPTVAIFDVRTMEEVRQSSLAELRLSQWLVGWFAMLTVALAAIGIAGVISFHVSSRIREYALRVALGAAPMTLARLVVARALRLTMLGLAAGASLAWLTTPLARALPGAAAAAGAPAQHAIVIAALAGLALAACALPARRAARVDPIAALRQD